MRSLRASNFVLYVQSIKVLLPLFFLLDNYYYTRWLSIHLLDVRELPTKVPEIAQAFVLGKFTTKKTIDMFYRSIALNQAHDRMNKTVKGEVRMVVLTENTAVFEKWMTPSLEWQSWWISLNKHYCRQRTMTKDIMSRQQHTRNDTKKNFCSMGKKVLYLGNFFAEESAELLCLSTKDVASTKVVNTVVHAKETGKAQYLVFVDESCCKV